MISRPDYIDDDVLTSLIREGLREDVGEGDVTAEATIDEFTKAHGQFRAKESGVVAGLEVASRVFAEIDPGLILHWDCTDGSSVESGQSLGSIRGNARSILLGERLALNFLQRMSGIATLTALMCSELSGSQTQLLDTRKTAPGLRVLDKWAVLLGGGINHRVGLFDMILIKENHIAAASSLEAALDGAAELAAQKNLAIEIEVTSIDELMRVLRHGGAHRVMLDNFVSVDSAGNADVSRLSKAVELINGALASEASGNVNLSTLKTIGSTGVDFVSIGALTHSVQALDISLLVTID